MSSQMPLSILLVDDEDIIHQTIGPYLRESGHQVTDATDGEQALAAAADFDFDLAIIDVQMPGMDGIALLTKMNQICPDTACVIITGHGDMEMVIQALRLGAADFIPKPVKLLELDAVIQKAARVRHYKKEERRHHETLGSIQNSAYRWRSHQRIVGVSRAMAKIREQIRNAVDAGCETIIITGETGSGKEVVAREIHLLGKNESAPFIAVSCPALPETLVESELFGHMKGTFTGAVADKAGCFETAHKGTLFLDEVADLSAAAQAKLLRVLETRSVRRVGGAREISVDVNVIAATNSPLGQLVENKKFRQDLFYRFNVFNIDIPPLRQRKEDIIPLAEHFLDQFLAGRRINVIGISESAKKALAGYDYPGNVRELRNLVERAAILCREGVIEPEHLAISTKNAAAREATGDDNSEAETIRNALEKCKWNRREAALDLGIPYATLRYKIKKYDLA